MQTLKKKMDYKPEDHKKENTDVRTIESRFGKVEIDLSTKISFSQGILGLPTAISFCLTDLPNIDNGFKLLQCVEDEKLSFVVIPAQYDNKLIDKEDLDNACKVLSLDCESLFILFVVTIENVENKKEVSMNVKAPILADAKSNQAFQHVLYKDKYQIKHMLS